MNRYLDINCCMSQRQRDVRFRASDPELKNNAVRGVALIRQRKIASLSSFVFDRRAKFGDGGGASVPNPQPPSRIIVL